MRFVIACALALPCLAHATPLMAPSPGGPVFVGPTRPSVSAMFWNPAASGLMQGHHFMVLATASLDAVSIQRARIDTGDGEPSATGDRSFASQTPLYATPGGIVAGVIDLSPFTLGAAGVLAFADQTPDLDPSLGYHSLGGSVYGTTIIFPSVSYRASSRLYFGISLSLLYSRIELRFLRDTALDSCAQAPCGVEDPARAERWELTGNWDSFPGIVSANAGTLFRVLGWWFGLSFTFPAGIEGVVEKEAKVSVTPAGGGAPIETRARVSYRVPWIISFGMRRAVLGGLELLLHAGYARLGFHRTIDIRLLGDPGREAGLPEWVVRNRDLSDQVTLEVGLEQPAAKRVRLGGRLRFQNGVVPGDAVAADQIDGPTLTLAGGLELRATSRLAFIVDYALGLQLPRDVTSSAYSPRAAIDCTASEHDLDTDECAAVREGRAIPTAAGHYSRIANQLSLGITYDLW